MNKELEEAKEKLIGFIAIRILTRNIFAMYKEELKELQDNIRIILQELENSVSKDKIREKIEELEDTLDLCSEEKIAKREIYALKQQIEILKELEVEK